MRKDGSRVPIYSSHTVVQVSERKQELFCIDIDLTQRKQAEDELRARNEELIIFNNAAVDRELRTIELKQEINALCAEAGQPPRYALQFMEENDDV